MQALIPCMLAVMATGCLSYSEVTENTPPPPPPPILSAAAAMIATIASQAGTMHLMSLTK